MEKTPKPASSFYQSHHAPYYIVTPEFSQKSSGPRMLHYLCHILNELGYEAYITTKASIPWLRTPELTPETQEKHITSGRTPIAVYPEIVSGNPLKLSIVARWILNKAGHLGGHTDFDLSEIIFYWDDWVLQGENGAERLFLPSVDDRIFNDNNTRKEDRTGFCFYAHKYLAFGGKISELITKNGISLCQDIPRSPEEIANILRTSKILYCYEPSNIVAEAYACGCPVILIDTEYLKNFDLTRLKIEKTEESKIDFSHIPSISEKLRERIEEDHKKSRQTVKTFIKKTQTAAKRVQTKKIKNDKKYSPINPCELEIEQNQTITNTLSEKKYKNWGNLRIEILNNTTHQTTPNHAKINFQIITRLEDENTAKLAETLDSLSLQNHPEWRLDIFSKLPPPDGIDEIPSIRWLTPPRSKAERKEFLRDATTSESDWVIEIPTGVILDPLYLWRLATSASEAPDAKAFFVDDDCYSHDGSRTGARFKPGCNPAALLSSDLAGILCVQRRALLALEDSNVPTGNSFAQLLGISEKFGWKAIRHIPDILLSYPDTFSSNHADCKIYLHEHMQRQGIEAEILQTGKQSWCIRRPLVKEPKVTITIISEGNFELLSRCLESICTLTQYKYLDILVSLKADDAIPDTLNLLREQEKKSGISIQSDICPKNSYYANRCNSAVDRIKSNFIVFLREEAQVIQETWLGELVRTATEDNVAAVMPRLIKPGSAQIENIGYVLGMNGVRGLPYQGSATIKDAGYLDYIQMPRDVSLLPQACYLIKKQSYLRAGGMDTTNFPDHWADADLSMRLRNNDERIICQPLSNLVFQITDEFDLPKTVDELAYSLLNKKTQEDAFIQRWWPNAAVDPFWNPNLSLSETTPTPETDHYAQWQTIPSEVPRIIARPVNNGQGIFRISAPINALGEAGKISHHLSCQGQQRDISAAELIRLSPHALIVQNYLSDPCLKKLAEWHKLPGRPFTVFALDDLITGLSESNPLRSTVPPNCRERLKFALAHCDRLVVSTEYLAEAYQHLITDIKVVPNRLEQKIWLPLHSKKRTGEKPRIGWAGGTTHQNDLLLLKEIIEQTRGEADWILFGMCPDEIRPLIAEFHPLRAFAEYPEYLASLSLDIAVAPLDYIPFNQGKSNLRLLEYGMLGIPVVCTDIDPYQGSPACCVPNTTASWVAALRERIHHPDAREREGIAMRRWVQQHYLLENHMDEWLNAHLPG